MPISQALLPEFDHEMSNTRKHWSVFRKTTSRGDRTPSPCHSDGWQDTLRKCPAGPCPPLLRTRSTSPRQAAGRLKVRWRSRASTCWTCSTKTSPQLVQPSREPPTSNS